MGSDQSSTAFLPMNTITQQKRYARSLANYWRERYAVVTRNGKVVVLPGRVLNYQPYDELLEMVLPKLATEHRIESFAPPRN